MSKNPPELDVATAMLLAANYVEQEERFDYGEVEVPTTCHDTGCVLGWIGFVIGSDCIIDTARKIGFEDDAHFYSAQGETVEGIWHIDATLAAKGLRRLAQERTA